VLVALVAAVAALLFAMASSAPASTTQLENGGFELADLTGWTADGYAGVTSQFDGGTPAGTYFAQEGDYFALLEAQGYTPETAVSISQSFPVNAGDTVSGSAFFWCIDTDNDSGWVDVKLNGTSVENGRVFNAAVNTTGTTQWTPWKYTFAESGTATIEAGVLNGGSIGSPLFDARFGLDKVQLTPASGITLPTTTASAVTADGQPYQSGALTTQAVTLTLKPTDDEGGAAVEKIYYKTPGDTSYQQYAAPLELVSSTAVTYYGVDQYGNMESPHEFIVNIDSLSPWVVVMTKPANRTDNVTATFSEPVKGVSNDTFILEQYIPAKGKTPAHWVGVTAGVSSTGTTAVLNPTDEGTASRKLLPGEVRHWRDRYGW
jgi:hypothetical protein